MATSRGGILPILQLMVSDAINLVIAHNANQLISQGHPERLRSIPELLPVRPNPHILILRHHLDRHCARLRPVSGWGDCRPHLRQRLPAQLNRLRNIHGSVWPDDDLSLKPVLSALPCARHHSGYRLRISLPTQHRYRRHLLHLTPRPRHRNNSVRRQHRGGGLPHNVPQVDQPGRVRVDDTHHWLRGASRTDNLIARIETAVTTANEEQIITGPRCPQRATLPHIQLRPLLLLRGTLLSLLLPPKLLQLLLA